MNFIEMTGRTIEEAKQNAISELGVTEDKVDVVVIDEGRRGLLSIIGKRPAKVKVTVKRDYCEKAENFLKNIFDAMGIDAEIKIKEIKDKIKIEIIGSNMGILIGYRGETLDSLQYLVSLVINKEHDGQYKRVIIDTENYRTKREETLKKLAIRMSHKVQKSRKTIKFEPMNPYERRIIHSALQNNRNIKTYSEGDEPNRYVVIDLKKA
ncbi:RNA-binding cell elongation regulator Jag/EloR [Clostridium pasteurianum]|uniref:RNA-binding protein KhpB n=1 Tax=Clostridium pasteurianum BC1 TaxID=86416 RepID=R4KD16_CLOPA|nr:RNA-binding cell elongation regulator Jag/EloR [Clostridium pasteurianum]AGK99581.1 putative RNA-binding protein [Clostridium pasteurianum BC1]